MFDRERGQDFAVEFDIGFFEHSYECGIFEPAHAERSIQAHLPEPSESALFSAAIPMRIDTSFGYGDFGKFGE